MGKWKGIKRGIQKDPDAPLQLYDLEKDIGERNNVAKENPEVAEQLEALLERYRHGGYSRELPPSPPAKTPVKPLAPVSGKTVRTENFDTVPDIVGRLDTFAVFPGSFTLVDGLDTSNVKFVWVFNGSTFPAKSVARMRTRYP